jgi:hypothetical protein
MSDSDSDSDSDIPINNRKVHINQYRGTVQCEELLTKVLTATTGTLSVTGNISVPSNPSSVGSAGAIAYDATNQSLIYSNGAEWRGAGSTLPGATILFKPNYAGPTSRNIFSDWSELCTAILNIDGPKIIVFDDSLMAPGDPIIVPAGNWDMTDVIWSARLSSIHTFPILFIQVNLSDGVIVNNLEGVQGPILITFFGTVVPAITVNTTISDRKAAFTLSYGARVACLGTQPFLRSTGGFYEVILLYSIQIYGIPVGPPPPNPYSLTPVFEVTDNSVNTLFVCVMSNGSIIEDNTFGGIGTTAFVRLTPGVVFSIPIVQPLLTGTVSLTSVYTNPDTYQRTVAPTNLDDDSIGYKIGDCWVNTAANVYYTCVANAGGSAIWNGPY